MYSGSTAGSDKKKIIESLIINSKRGGNSAFLNLIKIFIDDIYKASFKLTLTSTFAKKLSKIAILEMWQNIRDYDVEIPFKRWLIYYVISSYIKKKHEFISTKTNHSRFNEFNKHEKAFLSLPVNERIILCLYVELNYTEKEIKEKFSGMIGEDIDEIVKRNIPLIASSLEDDQISNLSNDNWEQIIALRKVEDNDEKLSLFLQLRNLVSEYEKYKSIVCNSFASITAPPDLADKIRESMIDALVDNNKRVEKERKQEKKIELKKNANLKKSKSKERTKSLQDKTSSQKVKQKNAKTGTQSKLSWVYLLAALGIAAAASFYFLFFQSSSCEIKNVTGVYQVNGTQSGKTNLAEGDIILTNNSSELELDLKNYGYIKLKENSSVQIVMNNGSLLNVKVIKGEFNCSFINPSDRFNINDELKIELTTGDASIKTNNSSFNLLIEPSANFKMDVNGGYVKVTDSNKSEYHLGAEYTLIQNQTGFIVPFNREAKSGMKELLEPVAASISTGQLKNILNIATEKDLLSLWHLIPKASSVDRESIITKINEFAFLPYEEVERKATQLNHESLNYILNLLMVNYL